MVALATAFVRLRLDTSRTKDDIDKGLTNAGGEKAASRKGRSIGQAFSKGFESGGSTFSRVAATMAARATIAGAAVAAATPAVVHFVAALAPAAGAVNAVIPAVVGLTAVMGTLKVATAGTGDAIGKGLAGDTKAFEKALDKLAPAQANFARQIVTLKPQLDRLQQTVARRFFTPLLDDVRPLANTFLPVLRKEMGGLAGQLGKTASSIAAAARTRPVVQALRDVFQQTAGAVKILRGQTGILIPALARGLSGVMPIFKIISQEVARLIPGFAAWLNETARTGAAVESFKRAVVVIKDLVGIFRNLGAIVSTVFGQAVGSSDGLLGKIRDLTTQARTFVESARGTKIIADLFQTMGVFGDALKRSLAGVLPQIGQALAISAPAAGQFAQAIANLLVALGPLLPALASVTASLAIALVPAMNALAKWLTENKGLLQQIAPFIIGYAVATKVAAAATVVSTVATRAWSVAVGVARIAQAGWTAISWLASAPVHAHTAAMALSTSTLGTWVGVKRLEAAAWLSGTAATVKDTVVKVANRAATLAHAAATGIASTATTFWGVVQLTATNIAVGLRLATLALWTAMKAHPFIAIISIITLVIGILVKLYQENETFRRIVDAVWKAVKTAIKAVGDWITGTLWPSLQRAFAQLMSVLQTLQRVNDAIWTGIKTAIAVAWNGIKVYFNFWKDMVTVVLPAAFRAFVTVVRTIFNTVRDAIKAVWDSIRTGSFDPIKNFITNTLPTAFRTGVAAITRAWDAVKEAARKPVAFVVNSVINPLINGWNTIAGVFGAPKATTIKGFEEGGRIPGAPSSRDNRLAMMTNPAGKAIAPMKVATGEYIVNAKSTSEWLPVLEAINKKRGKKINGVNPTMDGLAEGGLVGWAKGLANKTGDVLGGVFDTITDPSGTLKKIAEAAINRIPGAGGIRDLLTGAGRTLMNKVIAKIKDVFSFGGGSGAFGAWPSSPGAQRGDSGVWRKVVALIKSTGPVSGSFGNGYRPGDPKWHGSGRAVDWMGFGQDVLASFLASKKPLELIHRTGTRDYAYTRGKNKGSFNNDLMEAHRNHIHIAMRLGGLVERLANMPAIKLLDRGGSWASGTLGLNASGHTETVLTGGPNGDMAALQEVLVQILVAIRALGGDVAEALERPTRRAVQLGRGRGPAITGGTL